MSDVDVGECGDLHNGCLNITFADFRIYFTALDDKRRLFQLNKKKILLVKMKIMCARFFIFPVVVL